MKKTLLNIYSLTSALTTFFTQKNNGSSLDKIYNKLEQMENENIELKRKMDYLEKRLKNDYFTFTTFNFYYL